MGFGSEYSVSGLVTGARCIVPVQAYLSTAWLVLPVAISIFCVRSVRQLRYINARFFAGDDSCWEGERLSPIAVGYNQGLEAALAGERDRLVRLCAAITGEPAAAEDLAQETLVEAWSHRHKLYDASGLWPWLAAIAGNVCRRWSRSRGRESARMVTPSEGHRFTFELEESLAGEYDFEVELERDELAYMLDRAMSLLPAPTRALLVERYIEETSMSELAERLGTSEGAVAVKLHRGRLALRRVLSEDMATEASTYGLLDPQDNGWQETRVWCPRCGKYHLQGLVEESTGKIKLRCPVCSKQLGSEIFWLDEKQAEGIKSFKAGVTRTLNWARCYFGAALRSMKAPCTVCGRECDVIGNLLDGAFEATPRYMVSCPGCGNASWASVRALAQTEPEAQRFWREHPRMRSWPVREITYKERSAHLVTFESTTSGKRLDVIIATRPYEVAITRGG